MTPSMKKNVLKYDDVLFLDMQKRQINDFNWPYCSVMMTNGDKPGVSACESIVCEESTQMYVWLLKSILEMEPQFFHFFYVDATLVF